MTIKEMEEASGMSRANIRFYEKEDLLTPGRRLNGYRDYSTEDLELLKKIKLLRSLYMSLEDIRALANGTMRMDEALQKKIEELDAEQKAVANAKEVCCTMRAEQAAFGNLQSERYLELLHKLAVEDGIEEDWVKAKRIYAPYRRRYARIMDIVIMQALCVLVMVFVFHCSVTQIEMYEWIMVWMAAIVLAFVLEPFFLHWFATTPGKAIFHLQVRKIDGSKLSVSEARERLGEIFSTGFGAMFQGFAPKGFSGARANHELEGAYWYGDGKVDLPWEKHNHSYTIAENSWWRSILCIVLFVGCLGGSRYTPYMVKPDFHTGDLTPAEYAENINHYISTYASDSAFNDWEMQENGRWEKKATDRYVVTPGGIFNPQSCYIEVDENGYVNKVSYQLLEVDSNTWITDEFFMKMILASAFLGDQKSEKAFCEKLFDLRKKMDDMEYQSYNFVEEGLEFTNEVTYNGYEVRHSMLIPKEPLAEELYVEINFSIHKTK